MGRIEKVAMRLPIEALGMAVQQLHLGEQERRQWLLIEPQADGNGLGQWQRADN